MDNLAIGRLSDFANEKMSDFQSLNDPIAK